MKKTTSLMIIFVMLGTMFSVNFASAQTELPFTVISGDTPGKIDPHDAYDSVSINTITQVVEGLYAYNLSSPEMESIPRLAKEMGTWSPDGLNLTIELVEGVLFHNGEELNATHVKWNFDRINDMAGNLTGGWSSTSTPGVLYFNDIPDQLILNRTEIVDEYTVKFVLNKPWTVWEKLLAFSGCFIMYPDDDYLDTKMDVTNFADLIGTGPFTIDDIVPQETVEFTRFDNYWRGEANIEKMVYYVIVDGDTASLAMLNHEAHVGGVLPEYIPDAEEDPDITIERIKTTVVFYVVFNVEQVPIVDRKAMSFAYNYPYYINEVERGEDYELHTPIPEGFEFHNPDLPGLPYYNLTYAREMMVGKYATEINAFAATQAAEDIPFFQTTHENITTNDTVWTEITVNAPLATYNFTRYTSTTLERIKTLMTDNFKAIGIRLIDNHIGTWSYWADWVTRAGNKAKLSISFGGWGPDYNDPINMVEPIYKTGAEYNDGQYANATLDALMSSTYSLTGDARRIAFEEIQTTIAVDDVPTFYVQQRGTTFMYNNKYVDNVDANLNAFDNRDWYEVIYTPQLIPGTGGGGDGFIPGYNWVIMALTFVGVAGLLFFRERRK